MTTKFDAMLASLEVVELEHVFPSTLGELQHTYDDPRNHDGSLGDIAKGLGDVSKGFYEEVGAYTAEPNGFWTYSPVPRHHYVFLRGTGCFSVSFHGWKCEVHPDGTFGPQESVHPIEVHRLGAVEMNEIDAVLRCFITDMLKQRREREKMRRAWWRGFEWPFAIMATPSIALTLILIYFVIKLFL